MKLEKLLKGILLSFFLTVTATVFAQTPAPTITWSGYVGTYYAWDNDKSVVANAARQQSFIAPRKETFGLDVAMISGKYASEKSRATITFQYGDVTNGWGNGANATVNDLFGRYVQEANAGFLLADNLWLDAGFFLTHVGEEGFFPKDNFLSSLALTTLYEPFGQSGLRLSYAFNEKWSGQLHFLNGYGLTFGRANTSSLAVGAQVDFRASTQWDFLYNVLVGDGIGPNDAKKEKFYSYHNFVAKYFGSKVDFALGLDAASQAKSKAVASGIQSEYGSAFYWSAILEGRLKLTPKFNVMARAEIFQDANAIYSVASVDSDGLPVGLKATGFTGGAEFKPQDNAFLRVEARLLNLDDKQKPFSNGTEPKNSRVEVIFTTGVSF